MADNPVLAGFRDVRQDDGTINKDRWLQFLSTLQRAMGARTDVSGGNRTITINNIQSGSSGAANAPSEASVGLAIYAKVANTCNAQVGSFVYRTSGGVVGLADCRYKAKAATDVVYKIVGGTMWISPIGKNSRALMATGSGTNDNAILYLYQDGKATDDLTKIINATTHQYVGSCKFQQQVGVRVGDKRTDFVDADINVQRPGPA